MLSLKYYKEYGIDLPIYPVYYSIKKKIMVIDKPIYVQALVKQVLSRKENAKVFKVNQLYFDYIK